MAVLRIDPHAYNGGERHLFRPIDEAYARREQGRMGMARLLMGALRAGLIGLVLGPLFGLVWVFGLMMFDPACGSPGDSGGCAMGLVTVPVALALPSFALFALVSLVRNLWRLRPRDPAAAIRRLRNWGREE